jgi:hypothetical protein
MRPLKLTWPRPRKFGPRVDGDVDMAKSLEDLRSFNIRSACFSAFITLTFWFVPGMLWGLAYGPAGAFLVAKNAIEYQSWVVPVWVFAAEFVLSFMTNWLVSQKPVFWVVLICSATISFCEYLFYSQTLDISSFSDSGGLKIAGDAYCLWSGLMICFSLLLSRYRTKRLSEATARVEAQPFASAKSDFAAGLALLFSSALTRRQKVVRGLVHGFAALVLWPVIASFLSSFSEFHSPLSLIETAAESRTLVLFSLEATFLVIFSVFEEIGPSRYRSSLWSGFAALTLIQLFILRSPLNNDYFAFYVFFATLVMVALKTCRASGSSKSNT